MQNLPVLNNDESQTNFNFKEQIDRYIIHWRWFVLSVIICILTAFIQLLCPEGKF